MKNAWRSKDQHGKTTNHSHRRHECLAAKQHRLPAKQMLYQLQNPMGPMGLWIY